jgi:hypothetical protein
MRYEPKPRPPGKEPDWEPRGTVGELLTRVAGYVVGMFIGAAFGAWLLHGPEVVVALLRGEKHPGILWPEFVMMFLGAYVFGKGFLTGYRRVMGIPEPKYPPSPW